MSSKKATTENGLQLRDKEKPKRKKVRATIRYQFTIEESNEKSQELARSNKELAQLMPDKKQVVSDFNSKETALDSKINSLSNAVVNGYEIKSMDVMCEKNFDEREKIYFSLEDGRELMREKMTSEDFQLDLEETIDKVNEDAKQ